MVDLIRKIHRLHRTFAKADLPHAFGGALASAWCAGQARATINIDVNVFVNGTDIERVLAALPTQVRWTEADVKVLKRDLQCRLWFEHTPVDLFFNSTEWHEKLASRVIWEPLADVSLPFLCCEDLAVFKALFNRTKDWSDLEAMQEAGSLDISRVSAAVIDLLALTRFVWRSYRRLGGSKRATDGMVLTEAWSLGTRPRTFGVRA